ncbi:hypothetical protein JQ593_22580 [Bradyrhizobium viridifuturi]|jgi:hypothetical protein|nr:hypothetical protein [Acinetobacter baumannii]MBR1038873.1 hypothetical protein [Bradyrhizobium viridifuturi]MEE4417441.1 hypothetical protein [Klebsiella pneumoniae]OYU58610.1 MAG: hypothetical protein CFE30_30060 [Bradyrhizobium sp. PARBB1]RRB87725.1 hypothetical protein EIA20_24590 [Escherichia coli]DAR98604.1 MAG TPA: hypothetical protein [Caudoviricetes sp.]
MSPEDKAKGRAMQIARMRFNYIFREAWVSIARERGWFFDAYLGTSSHGTIALRSYLSASGL